MKKKTFTTHEHVESAIDYLLRLVASATPAEQPSGDVLLSLERMLVLHRRDTPANDVDERLAALKARVEALETRTAFAGAVKQR